ncbi:hypothetical protein, partial [Candidatus Magnetominusculus dajiuhuensis]|uniref:hypothetical protein n=1 Tax=Candidatus Magnetominusculus dajiuhuensis TaxID=3137712 RepID=UPI003B43CA0A
WAGAKIDSIHVCFAGMTDKAEQNEHLNLSFRSLFLSFPSLFLSFQRKLESRKPYFGLKA